MEFRVFAADNFEDYALAVSLRLQDPGAGWLPVFRCPTSRLPAPAFPTSPLDELLGDHVLVSARRREYVAERWRASWNLMDGEGFAPMAWALEFAGLAGSEPGTWCERLAAVPPAERPSLLAAAFHPAAEGFVVGAGDPRWALPAMLHAALSERPFLWLDCDQDLIAAAESPLAAMTVCTALPSLRPELLHGLAEARSFRLGIPRLAHVSLQARPVSFLTARTLEVLTFLVAKHHLYRQAPLARTGWIFLLAPPVDGTDPEVTLLARPEANAANIRSLPEETELLMAYGHSREDIFYVGSDVLCGASQAAAAVPEARAPVCAHEGRCIKSGDVVPVWELPAKAFFVNGCSTLRLGGGNFAPEYTLGFSFLEGAGSLFVASSRTHYGNPHELLLLYHLLRSGMTVGDSVRLVNNSLPLGGSEIPNYLILGEGDWQPFAASLNRVRMTVTPEADGWKIECADIDAQYVEVRIPQLLTEPFIYAAQRDSQTVEIYHAVTPEPDGSARLFLFGWRRLRLAALTIWVRFESPAAEQVEALRTAHQNLVYSRLYRTYSPKIKNLEVELQSLSTAIARQLGKARYSPLAAEKVVEKANQVEGLISRMNRLVCEYLLNKVATSAFVLTDQYMETDGSFQVAEHLPSEAVCPYCGNRILRRVVHHQIISSVRREVDLCIICGNVWDVPQGGLRPEYRNAAVVPRGAAHPFEVLLRNTTGRRVRGWLGFRLYQAETYGVALEPPMTEVTLEAGEECAVPFSLWLDEAVPAHMEWLKGFWVSDLDISYFQRNLWVVPTRRVSPRAELPALAAAVLRP